MPEKKHIQPIVEKQTGAIAPNKAGITERRKKLPDSKNKNHYKTLAVCFCLLVIEHPPYFVLRVVCGGLESINYEAKYPIQDATCGAEISFSIVTKSEEEAKLVRPASG